MRIAVIGAGIVGVTTAYELALAGHEVTVFDRCASVASEASFANAGIVAPGVVSPWAAPGMPWKVLRHLLGRDAPVRLPGLAALAPPALAVALVACVQTGRARRQPHRHAAAGALQLRAPAGADAVAAARLRTAARPAGAAAQRSRAGTSPRRPEAAGRTGRGLRTPGCRAHTGRRAGTARGHGAARRHPPAERRRRQLPPVRTPAEGAGAAAGCRLPPWRRGAACRSRHTAGRAHSRRQRQLRRRGAVHRRRVRQPAASAGPAAAPGGRVRLLAHGAAAPHRWRRRHGAPCSADGRTPQGRDLAPGPACARGRQRRAGRIARPPARAGAAHAVPRARRLVSRCGAQAEGATLEGRAADAARRPAGAGRQRRRRRLAEPGPRLQRLGAGLRLGTRAGRTDQRPRRGVGSAGPGHRAPAR